MADRAFRLDDGLASAVGQAGAGAGGGRVRLLAAIAGLPSRPGRGQRRRARQREREIDRCGLAGRHLDRGRQRALLLAADRLHHILAGRKPGVGELASRLGDDHEIEAALGVLHLHERALDRRAGRVLDDPGQGSGILRRCRGRPEHGSDQRQRGQDVASTCQISARRSSLGSGHRYQQPRLQPCLGATYSKFAACWAEIAAVRYRKFGIEDRPRKKSHGPRAKSMDAVTSQSPRRPGPSSARLPSDRRPDFEVPHGRTSDCNFGQRAGIHHGGRDRRPRSKLTDR